MTDTTYPAAELASDERRDELLEGIAVAAGLILTLLAVSVALTSDQPGDRYVVALVGGLSIAVPVAVGLVVWRSGESFRFGQLLVAWGLLNFLPILSTSTDETTYSLGRLGVWLVEPMAIAAVLAFPTGTLKTAVDRALVWVAVATVALLYLPTALLVERYPEPSLWLTCSEDCPENAFMVTDTQPAVVDALMRPLRELITITLYVAVIGVLYRRLRSGTPLANRMLAPVLAVAIARSFVVASSLVVRRFDGESILYHTLSWLFILGLPALALAFYFGLVRSRLAAGRALQALATRLRRDGGERVQDALASTLGDPSLEIAYWVHGSEGRWVDADGREVDLPAPDSGRWVTEVVEDGRRVAALIHDPALAEQQGFVQAAGAFALTTLENERLRAQVESSFASLIESRARIQTAADRERRRIERDLHDGTQQRLVSLRVRLELAGETVRTDPDRAPGLLRELAAEVDETLEEVRGLSHGIYPSLLTDHGLDEALRAAARRAPITTTLATRDLRRYAQEIESAVYFCCLEALQNVAKHANGATSISISIVDDGALRFDVRDDGSGFDTDAGTDGFGLANMRDRIGAVDGELTITSVPGQGTQLAGVVPLR
jgi:signal transduction histidine kinase